MSPSNSTHARPLHRLRSRSAYKVTVAISATTATTLPVFLTGALAVQIRHGLHFGVDGLGLLVAAFFAAAALVSFGAGSVAERLGGERIMRVCALASALVVGSIALFAHSFETMLVLLVLAGLINGSMQPAVNLFVIGAVPAHRRGFALGIKQAAIPVSTLFAGLSVPIIALTVGWHFAYALAAVVALVVFVAVPPGKSTGGAGVAAKEGRRVSLPLAPIGTLTVGMALGAGTANALGAFLVENAVHAGWSPGAAGLLVALGSVSGLSSRLLGGHLADRRGGRHLPVIAGMLLLGAAGYAFLASGASWLILPATIVCYAAGWGWNGVFNFAIIVNHPGAEGRATGMTQAGAFVGSVAGPLLFGYAVAHFGFSPAWWAATLSALAAAGAMMAGRKLLLREKARRSLGGVVPG